jgi:hypothetical protein
MMDVSGSMTDEQKRSSGPNRSGSTPGCAASTTGRAALHHPRRGGQGGRRAHVLSHPRKRRHADQLGLQGLRRSDRPNFPGRVEHLLLPVLRRRQLGRRQPPGAGILRETLLPPATCSATARSKAPTAAASSSASLEAAFGTNTKRWCSRRSPTKTPFTNRSKRFWERGKAKDEVQMSKEARPNDEAHDSRLLRHAPDI